MKTYQEFCDDMILRDLLALDRTILANKRTLMSYVRTSIGLLAGGIGMVKLVADRIVTIIGFVFIAAALPVLIIGVADYNKMHQQLTSIRKHNDHDSTTEIS